MFNIFNQKWTGEIITTPCSYYLYSRSSTGSKTPLRLSNSVGIMDSGYRGNVIACFDNIDYLNNMNNTSCNITAGHRLLQICSPNIIYPVFITIVSHENDLEICKSNNIRGSRGFGSSGQ